jgi:hypothetical protein
MRASTYRCRLPWKEGLTKVWVVCGRWWHVGGGGVWEWWCVGGGDVWEVVVCGRRARSASCWVSAVTSAAGAAAKQQPSEVTHSEAAAALIRLGVPQPRAVARCRTRVSPHARKLSFNLMPRFALGVSRLRCSARAAQSAQAGERCSQCKARSASWRSPFSLRWGCNRGVGGSGNMGRLILGLTRFP